MCRLLSLFILLFFSLNAMAKDSLHIAVDANNPPFMFANEDGQAQGLYPEMLKKISQRSGINIVLEAMPWKRALGYLDNGSHGVAGIYRNEERQRKYLFSAPLYREELVVYRLRHDKQAPFTGIASLYGKHVGVLAGWFYSEEFSRARAANLISAEETSQDLQNVNKLKLHRLDYLIGIRESIAPLAGSDLEEVGTLASKLTYIALPRNRHTQSMLPRLNEAITPLR